MRLSSAGPGHSPLMPQPAPNSTPPVSSRVSMALAVGNWKRLMNSGCCIMLQRRGGGRGRGLGEGVAGPADDVRQDGRWACRYVHVPETLSVIKYRMALFNMTLLREGGPVGKLRGPHPTRAVALTGSAARPGKRIAPPALRRPSQTVATGPSRGTAATRRTPPACHGHTINITTRQWVRASRRGLAWTRWADFGQTKPWHSVPSAARASCLVIHS